MNWINRKSTYSEVLDVLEDNISIYKGKVLRHVSLPHDEWLRKYYMQRNYRYLREMYKNDGYNFENMPVDFKGIIFRIVMFENDKIEKISECF